MAAIQNERTLMLQATVPRIVVVPIPIDQVEGLGPALKRLSLDATATTIYNTSPATVTITATRHNGVTGPITWSTTAGTLTGTGDSRSIAASSIPLGANAVIQATADGVGVSIVVNRASALASQQNVNLATQITGQLANANVNGLGALALLPNVNLSSPTQVVGNLAADRLGVGTLAAGVIYAGTVNVANLVGTTISGKDIVGGNAIYIAGSNSGNSPVYMFTTGGTHGELGVKGGFTAMNNTGSTLITAFSSTVRIENAALALNVSSLSGTMGDRIILKNVTYTVSVDGGPNQTVRFL